VEPRRVAPDRPLGKPRGSAKGYWSTGCETLDTGGYFRRQHVRSVLRPRLAWSRWTTSGPNRRSPGHATNAVTGGTFLVERERDGWHSGGRARGHSTGRRGARATPDPRDPGVADEMTERPRDEVQLGKECFRETHTRHLGPHRLRPGPSVPEIGFSWGALRAAGAGADKLTGIGHRGDRAGGLRAGY